MEKIKANILDGNISEVDLERLCYALEVSGDGIFDWNVEKNTCYISPSWCHELGLDPSNLHLNFDLWKKAIHPEDAQRVSADISDHLEGRTTQVHVDYRIAAKNGNYIWVASRGKVISRDPSGRALRVVGTRSNITRQKEAEFALRDKNLQWSYLMTIAPVGIYQAGVDGICTYVNKTWSNFTGISPEEAVGRLWLDFVPQEDHARVLNEWALSIKNSSPFSLQYRHRNSRGEDRWVLGNAVSINNSKGELVGYVGTVQDISAMRNAHERLQNFLENIPAGAVYIENEKMLLNRACENIIGYSRDEITTLEDWFRLLQKKDSKAHRAIYEQHKRDGFKLKPVIPITRKDGQIRHIEFSGVNQGSFEVWHLNDLTERLLSEEKFRVLFERSTDAHLLFDENGIVDCNLAAVAMLGFTNKAEVLGVHPAVFSPQFQPDGISSAEKSVKMDEIARTVGFHRFEWTHKKKDGTEFPVEVTLNPVVLNSRAALLVVWHDLTDQKKFKHRLRSLPKWQAWVKWPEAWRTR